MAEQMELNVVQEQNAPKEEPKQEQKTEIIDVGNMEEMRLFSSNDGKAFTSLAALKEAFTIGKYFATSNLVPQAYQNKPMDCAIAIDIANRMGVSPVFVMQNLSVVRGIPSWSGQACMAIIRGCGRFEDVKLVYTGEKGKDTRGCYVSAKYKKSGEEVRGTEITMAMVHSEGWDKNSKWKSMPEQMLGYRASSFFARLYCPNELQGFRVEGEAEDIKAEKKETVREANPFDEVKK